MSNIISKSHKCPYRIQEHENLAFVVYQNGHYCYSCGKGSIKSDAYYSFRGNYTPLKVDETLVVPTHSTSIKDFPLHIKAWLYNYYVFDELIVKYHIGYCPYVYYTTNSGQVMEGESILFPIIIDHEMVGYQQRFFPTKHFFSKNTKTHIVEFGNHNTSTVVIVEDYISALRVGEIQNSIWLGGISLTNTHLSYIIKMYTNIYIWLDGDEPGQQNALKILTRLKTNIEKETNWFAFSNLGPRILRNIMTELDPKCYSNEEIRGILT